MSDLDLHDATPSAEVGCGPVLVYRLREALAAVKTERDEYLQRLVAVKETLRQEREMNALARRELEDYYDGPETPGGSSIAMAMALLEGETNALYFARRRQW